MFDLKRENPSQYVTGYNLVLKDWDMVDECYVIYDNSTPIALLDMDVYNDEKIMTINEFETLIKGVGDGSQIINELKVWAQEDGLTITLYPYSTQSRNFWGKNGFHEVEEGNGVFSMEYTPD